MPQKWSKIFHKEVMKRMTSKVSKLKMDGKIKLPPKESEFEEVAGNILDEVISEMLLEVELIPKGISFFQMVRIANEVQSTIKKGVNG